MKIDVVHRARNIQPCGRRILLKPWKTAFVIDDTRNVENRCQIRNERFKWCLNNMLFQCWNMYLNTTVRKL